MSKSAPAYESAPAHESAAKHVSGRAVYIDDLPEQAGCLHAYLGLAEVACGTIKAIDFDAVLASDGVVGVLTGDDIPGANDVSPTGAGDDPVFARDVMFHGQPIFAVVATSRAAARRAARRADVTYDQKTPVLDVADATDLVTAPLVLQRGDADVALAAAPHRIAGQMRIGGQDHFYLEGQIAYAIPGEDADILVWSSTQHPSEVQHMVAHVLGLCSGQVTVKVRRMGGGFGGKETQANIFACVAAVAARKFGQAVKLRPDRDDDMIATGKRHDFLVTYDVGFDDNGVIEGVAATFKARAGNSADLSGPVTDRALFHADNCYYFPAVRLASAPLRTNTVSNTAFRGFGGPQGMVAGERMIEEIACALGCDPLEVRKANLYATGRNITPYFQEITDNIAPRIIAQVEGESDYAARRKDVLAFNAHGGTKRKGIALTPVKFGISFTATWYNQAGALVHIYRDGSLQLNHGGTEMGQGLNSKVASVLAREFDLPLDRVSITATATDKVPNTSATAASSGSDLNGMAALNAAEKLKARLAAFAGETYGTDKVVYRAGQVLVGDQELTFAAFVEAAYMARVSLSATGFYKTPDIHWDREKGQGRPFYYFAYGASVSEVTIDTLTGEYAVDRVDIVHDVGRSLNPAIDIGQIEGGFVQGMGWLTHEELVWGDDGRLLTHAPSTYKIPLASDVPDAFNVTLADWSENREMTIRRSKAVGEPPFMLANSVLEALSMAVASVADYKVCPRLDTPATPERILMALERLRAT